MPERDYQEIAQAWARWLAEHLGKLRQVDLVQRSSGTIKPALVSRWMRGDHAPSVENAILVAQILGTDVVETLRAGGHQLVADLVEGGVPDPGAEDPVISRIMGETALAPEHRELMAAEYRKRVQENRDYFAQQLAIAVAVRRRALEEARGTAG